MPRLPRKDQHPVALKTYRRNADGIYLPAIQFAPGYNLLGPTLYHSNLHFKPGIPQSMLDRGDLKRCSFHSPSSPFAFIPPYPPWLCRRQSACPSESLEAMDGVRKPLRNDPYLQCGAAKEAHRNIVAAILAVDPEIILTEGVCTWLEPRYFQVSHKQALLRVGIAINAAAPHFHDDNKDANTTTRIHLLRCSMLPLLNWLPSPLSHLPAGACSDDPSCVPENSELVLIRPKSLPEMRRFTLPELITGH